MKTDEQFLRVPGEWLNACGMGAHSRVFPVMFVDRLTFCGRAVTMVTVDRGGARPWVVHMETRGAEFVPDPALTRAVRAFERIWDPIAVEQDVHAAADAEFDGGEWSGPLNAKRHELERLAMVRKVALRFGVNTYALNTAIEQHAHRTLECLIDAAERREEERMKIALSQPRMPAKRVELP